MMRILNRVHLNPYLIGIFPVLSLYAHNQSQLDPGAPWRSFAVILVGTTVAFVALRFVLRDWYKAGFVTSYASLLFFLYGPLREILYKVHTDTLNLGWNRYFFPLWLLILALGIWVILKKVPAKASSLQLFNLIALSTIILPLISVISYAASHLPVKSIQAFASAAERQQLARDRKLPDIYYIVLDMYARSDTIEEQFGYDNSPFLNELRRQGFYVASCSTANYSHTVMSMASSLNMDFLSALGDDFVPGNKDYTNSTRLIRNNAVRQYLQAYGYSFVSFESFFPYIDIPESDVYIKIASRKDQIQPFELLLIEKTPGKIILDRVNAYRANTEQIRLYGTNYDRTLFVLDQLAQLPGTVSSPKFVYAHLFIPHPPYVFGPDGEYVGNDERLNGGPYGNPVDEAAYRQGYTNHLRFLGKVMPDILTRLISQSEQEPIIILQGDHGFMGDYGLLVDPVKRLPILNAYYLPGKDASQLVYPEITPVNTFRVILNAYFDGRFELLPDEKYPTINLQDYYNVKRMEPDAIACNPK
jgi:hypothetical protein